MRHTGRSTNTSGRRSTFCGGDFDLVWSPSRGLRFIASGFRPREFVADAEGAQIAGSPHGLVSALRKLDASARRIPMHNPNPAMNNMFIVEPLVGKTLTSLFASHPPTEKRIAALLTRS